MTVVRALGALAMLAMLPDQRAFALQRSAYVIARGPLHFVEVNVETGLRTATFPLVEGRRPEPSDVIIPPDDSSVAYVVTGCEVVAFDLTRGGESTRIPTNACCVHDIAVSRDGSMLAAIADDITCAQISIIDLRSSATPRTIALENPTTGLMRSLGELALSPDASEVFVLRGVEDEHERFWRELIVANTGSGHVVRQARLDNGSSGPVALTPDGNLVFVGDSYGSVTALDAKTLTSVWESPHDGLFAVTGFAFSDTGELVYVGRTSRSPASHASQVDIIDTRTWQGRSLRFDFKAGRPTYDSQGGLLLLPAADALGTLAVIDPTSAAIVHRAPVGQDPLAVAIGSSLHRPAATPTPAAAPTRRASPARDELCVFTAHKAWETEAGGISIIDGATSRLSTWFPVGRPAADPWSDDEQGADDVAISPDGRYVYALSAGRGRDNVSVYAADTGSMVDQIAVGRAPHDIAIRPDGLIAYVAQADSIAAIDLKTREVVAAFFTPGQAMRVAFAPDGMHAYVATRESRGHPYYDDVNWLVVIDAHAHRIVETIALEPLAHLYDNAIAVSPDGNRLYVAGHPRDADQRGRVLVLDRYTGEVADDWLLSPDMETGSIAVHPSGRSVYVVGMQRSSCRLDPVSGACNSRRDSVVVFDAVTGAAGNVVPLNAYATDIAISPRGNLLYATDGYGGEVYTIDLRTSSIVATTTVDDRPWRIVVGETEADCPPLPLSESWPTRTATPTFLPDVTPPRPTPVEATATPTRRVDCTAGCVRVAVDRVRGVPGERVAVTVRLHTEGFNVAGVESELTFVPELPFASLVGGTPDCRVNRALNKTGTFVFYPTWCFPGVDCTFIRTLVLSLVDLEPISDGAALFTCEIAIPISAGAGFYPVMVRRAGGSDPTGEPLPVIGVDGFVQVRSARDDETVRVTSAQDASLSRVDGCTVGGRDSAGNLGLWLAALLLAAGRRIGRPRHTPPG